VSEPGGAVPPANLSSVSLVGSDSYQTDGLVDVVLKAAQIFNSSATRTTGTLRLELWVSRQPYVTGGSGWRVATWQISGSSNGTLGPRQSFLGLTSPALALVGLPPPGTYFAYMLLTEYSGSTNTCAADHFCLDAFADFNGQFYVPDVVPPTVPTGLTVSARSATQLVLNWNASVDNAGVTAYKVYSNGILIGAVASNAALVYNLFPASTHQFAVAACDAAENCSAQSIAVAGTTPAAVLPADCVFNWAEQKYPQYFSPAGRVSATSAPYYYRYYSNTQTYIAISSANSDVWVLGPLSGNKLLDVGPLSAFIDSAACAQ
jgi:hypothetical protein